MASSFLNNRAPVPRREKAPRRRKEAPARCGISPHHGPVILTVQSVSQISSRQHFVSPSFSQGIGCQNKQDIDDHGHDRRGRRAATDQRIGQVEHGEHKADHGENKRGLCLAWVLCRMAGKNSFCYRIGHIFFSQRNYVPTAAPLSKGRLPLFSHFFRATF